VPRPGEPQSEWYDHDKRQQKFQCRSTSRNNFGSLGKPGIYLFIHIPNDATPDLMLA
jgi:hypothetical protein